MQSDGAIAVAPPSMHESRKRYRFAPGLDPESVELADPPDWLVELARDRSTAAATPVEDWRRIVIQGAVEGERNDTLTRLAGHLLGKNVDPIVVLNLLLAWNTTRCHPPLSDDEVFRSVNSIAGRELARCRR